MRAMPRFALNSELLPIDGTAPEWVELIPAPDPITQRVSGRDGRSWLYDDLARHNLLGNFQARRVDLVIDWEHSTQNRAPVGLDAPAAAWAKELELRGGALWGRVEWTPEGDRQVAGRSYRYLSPVFDYEESTNRIVRMVSAGLNNTPNLHVQALNSEEEATVMTRSTALAAAIAACGLKADASDDDLAAQLNTLKVERDTAQAKNSEAPSLAQFVPRADYDNTLARATNAEQKLKERDTADHTKAVDGAITSALQAGKITPATEAYHRAACSDTEGLARFQAFVGAAPAVADATNLGQRQADGNSTALNTEEQTAARLLGLSTTDFVAAKTAQGK